MTRAPLPIMPATNSSGLEGRHRRQDREGDGPGDLAGAFDRAAQALAVLLLVPVDVLVHDDGVVDDDAQHEGEREERQHVAAHRRP